MFDDYGACISLVESKRTSYHKNPAETLLRSSVGTIQENLNIIRISWSILE
jgi:hypothetical protein